METISFKEKIDWLKTNAKVKIREKTIDGENVTVITVYSNQNPKGVLVRKHTLIDLGFSHYTYEWSQKKSLMVSCKVFHESEINQAIAYAKDRIDAVEEDLNNSKEGLEFWLVYEPKKKHHFFNSFDDARKKHEEIYSELELI